MSDGLDSLLGRLEDNTEFQCHYCGRPMRSERTVARDHWNRNRFCFCSECAKYLPEDLSSIPDEVSRGAIWVRESKAFCKALEAAGVADKMQRVKDEMENPPPSPF